MMIAGDRVPPALTGPLQDSTALRDDPVALRRALTDDGYVLLRGVLPEGDVLAARGAVLDRLAAVDETDENGVASGRSRRAEKQSDLGAFWQDISESDHVRRVTHGTALTGVLDDLLDEPSTAFDFVWLRAMAPGRASGFHFDHVYMNRGSQQVLTCWIPFGDVRAEDGPIVVVEGSHRFDDLIDAYRDHDVDRDPTRPGVVDEAPAALAAARGRRLLSGDFAAGDVLIFGMFLLHGSADNRSSRVRLSCDVRYQPAVDARDERWFGAPPPGHGGLSYGGLNAAQPLTAEPVKR